MNLIQHEKQPDGQVVIYERELKGDEMHVVSNNLITLFWFLFLYNWNWLESVTWQFGRPSSLQEALNRNSTTADW